MNQLLLLDSPALPAAPAALIVPPPAAARTARMKLERPTPPEGCTNDWHTLDEDFLPLMEEFRFTVDAYASDELHKLPRYWTKERDAAAQNWRDERVFANPPYGRRLLSRAMATMARMAADAALIVALVPAYTDRAWWHHHVEPGRRAGTLEVRFFRRRLRFGWPGLPGGHPRCVASFSSCVVIWRRP